MKTTRLHMHKWSAIFVILLVLIVSSHTNLAAQTWPNGSTGQLVDGCKQNDGVWAGYCRGLVIGISAVLTANSELSPGSPIASCYNENMSTAKIIRGFLDWADSNPTKLGEAAPVGFVQYMVDTYPCR
jgi:hypothetical protein